MKSNLGLFVTKRALLNPNMEALVDVSSGRRYTYPELNERCNRAANGLGSIGTTKGDRTTRARWRHSPAGRYPPRRYP